MAPFKNMEPAENAGSTKNIGSAAHLGALLDMLDRRERAMLSGTATFGAACVRRRTEPRGNGEYRQAFSLDVDRIMHSLAYTRYIDKPQVFYLTSNDHITHRVLHVQLVSKIGRTIGRFLGLNEDLIEAVALGHDIGHTPFGHDGENCLSRLCKAAGIDSFCHSVQGVRFLDQVERKGRGWNLSLQTLDGILCHDGEIHNQRLIPQTGKSFAVLDREIREKTADPKTSLMPMTPEGCVVRMADTISYIGRDIEDAIRMNIIKRSDLPADCVKYLGDTNGKIVYRLVTDVIQNSVEKDYVAYSPEVSFSLNRLKQFNLENIYLNPRIKSHTACIEKLFELLFERYMDDLLKQNRESVIFSGFLEDMSDSYLESNHPARIVRDFMAGMTDRYFLRQCPEKLRPQLPEDVFFHEIL